MSTTDHTPKRQAAVGCTCCAVHGQGVNREALGTPVRVAETPELAKAARTLDAANDAAKQAHQTWSDAEVARRTFEAGLYGRYESHPRGIEQASREERRQLEELLETAKKLLDKYRSAAQLAAEARQVHAAATHRATQQMIASW